MFHSQSLSRKGSLGSVWVAAYCHKRLKKAQVTQTDIPHSVDTILQDGFDVVAYRVLAYFLLGVVRIFSKKVEYLFDDCHKVLVNIKAFVVSNTKDKRAKIVTAPPLSLITVPKSFKLDAFDLEVLEDFSGGNVTSREDITLIDKTRGNKGMWEYSLCEHHWVAGHDTFSFNDNPAYDVSSPRQMETDAGPGAVEEHNNLQASAEKPRESSFTQEESMNLLTLHKYKEDIMDAGRPSSDDNMIDREQTENVEVTLSVKETLPAADDRGDDGGMFCTSPEKIRGDGCVESMDTDIASGVDRELVELTVKPEERLLNFLNGGKLTVPSPQSLEPLVMKDHPIAAQLNATPEPKLPDPQGETTPDFLLIPTPKVKERPRTKRKKSCLYDELIMLPSEVLKKGIIDSSQLVCKRRKTPHTAFAVWKAHRRSHLSFEFVEPLMSGMSAELMTLFSENNIRISEGHEPPGGIEKVDVEGPEKINISELRTFDGSSEQIEIAPETPDLRASARRPFSSPKEDFRLDQNGPIVLSGVADLVAEQNEQGDCELDFSLLTEEFQETGAPKEDGNEFGHWTGRTRLVARCFHKIFKNQRKRGEPEAVSLMHVSERKTARESARLFYEILVLTSRSYVDVEQDDAYGDIVVKKDFKWEQAFGVRSP